MWKRRALVGVSTAIVVAALGASPAAAHPLGNFSINHLDSLTFEADRVSNDAIVDTAEIPTAQAEQSIDANGDGTASPAEMSTYGVAQCAAYRESLTLTVAGSPVAFTTTSTAFEYRKGQAGLQTTRLECRFEAPVDLSQQRSVEFRNDFAPNRVGWHEIVAIGEGETLVDSPVPTASVTEGLTVYPVDLLSSPVDVRSATFSIEPGAAAVAPATTTAKTSESFFTRAFNPFSSAVERVNRVFNDLVGRQQLTLGVGLLAIGLALILGASHALLPGHGKTVMAAYIAGRQGSVRDAVLVGATVTATHTGGVLILGLALTLSSSLAGESVLGYLGVISGLMIAVLGASLLRSASRRRSGKAGAGEHGHGHSHAFGHGHSHGPHGHGLGGHSHGDHSHPHAPRTKIAARVVAEPEHQLVGAGRLALVSGTRLSSAQLGGAGGSLLSATAASSIDISDPDAEAIDLLRQAESRAADHDAHDAHDGHDHDGHDHDGHDGHDHDGHDHDGHDHDGHDHHGHDHHGNGHDAKPVSRMGLVGMGIAGGLVPSPSALVVLLSAIALGRTVFGVVLVVGYGAGMAGTLTLAGVLLVRVRDRYQHRVSATPGRARRAAMQWTRYAPYMTAALVLVVGLGLAARSLGQI